MPPSDNTSSWAPASSVHVTESSAQSAMANKVLSGANDLMDSIAGVVHLRVKIILTPIA
jgi:hypothetical protein